MILTIFVKKYKQKKQIILILLQSENPRGVNAASQWQYNLLGFHGNNFFLTSLNNKRNLSAMSNY